MLSLGRLSRLSYGTHKHVSASSVALRACHSASSSSSSGKKPPPARFFLDREPGEPLASSKWWTHADPSAFGAGPTPPPTSLPSSPPPPSASFTSAHSDRDSDLVVSITVRRKTEGETTKHQVAWVRLGEDDEEGKKLREGIKHAARLAVRFLADHDAPKQDKDGGAMSTSEAFRKLWRALKAGEGAKKGGRRGV
ncbi:hypothetical protein JCM8097_004948 [Rhodosporidiobolus ruineniae]